MKTFRLSDETITRITLGNICIVDVINDCAGVLPSGEQTAILELCWAVANRHGLHLERNADEIADLVWNEISEEYP